MRHEQGNRRATLRSGPFPFRSYVVLVPAMWEHICLFSLYFPPFSLFFFTRISRPSRPCVSRRAPHVSRTCHSAGPSPPRPPPAAWLPAPPARPSASSARVANYRRRVRLVHPRVKPLCNAAIPLCHDCAVPSLGWGLGRTGLGASGTVIDLNSVPAWPGGQCSAPLPLACGPTGRPLEGPHAPGRQ